MGGGGGLGQGATGYTLTRDALTVRYAAPDLDALVEQARSQAPGGTPFTIDREQVRGMLGMMGLGELPVVIHVPGEVRGVDGLPFEQLDDNTVRLTVDMLAMLDGGEGAEATIRFKRRRKFRRLGPLR